MAKSQENGTKILLGLGGHYQVSNELLKHRLGKVGVPQLSITLI